jgi:hypothetical protein
MKTDTECFIDLGKINLLKISLPWSKSVKQTVVMLSPITSESIPLRNVVGIYVLMLKSYYKLLIFCRTPFRNVPSIGGKEIDLYLLYWLVTSQGGWERVSLSPNLEEKSLKIFSFTNLSYISKPIVRRTFLNVFNRQIESRNRQKAQYIILLKLNTVWTKLSTVLNAITILG